MRLALAAAGLALLTLAPSHPTASDATLDFSAPAGSGKPFLSATPSGGLLATWFEPRGENRWALLIAARESGRWGAPVPVVEGDRFFVNWADFPSGIETADGRWVVHWLERTAAKSYAYHIRISTSADRGKTWTTPVTPHRDRSDTEHGFVAMVPRSAGGPDLVWLDGRQTADTSRHGAMALFAGSIDGVGRVAPDVLLDARTCDCCQTALARTSEGLIAAYRDRSAEEIRDISVVRQVNGRWTGPSRVAQDGWVYRACPVNGPAIAADRRRVVVAWFTGADGTPRVELARSTDAGASFGPPVELDDGNPLGRADVELLPDGSALVTWLEIVRDQAEWRVKRVAEAGRILSRWRVGSAPRTREAGFARTALSGGDLFVAWTAPGEGGGVRISRLAKP